MILTQLHNKVRDARVYQNYEESGSYFTWQEQPVLEGGHTTFCFSLELLVGKEKSIEGYIDEAIKILQEWKQEIVNPNLTGREPYISRTPKLIVERDQYVQNQTEDE